MSVTKFSNLGEITTNFLLNDVDVYVMNTSATGGYVGTDWALLGYTSPEKSINPIIEKYVREDKIPRVPTYSKVIRAGLEISCDLSNQNPEFEAIIKQGTITSLGATGTRIAYGTNLASVEYRAVRFVASKDSGSNWALTIPKCEITQNGEKTVGGEEESKTPLMFKSFYNSLSTVNATANLYYENDWASTISVTADVPDGY